MNYSFPRKKNARQIACFTAACKKRKFLPISRPKIGKASASSFWEDSPAEPRLGALVCRRGRGRPGRGGRRDGRGRPEVRQRVEVGLLDRLTELLHPELLDVDGIRLQFKLNINGAWEFFFDVATQ